MGLLEELRGQAKEISDAKGEAATEQAHEVAVAAEQLDEKMRVVYRYFYEIIAHLQTLSPKISVDYKLPEFTEPLVLRQSDYRIWKQAPDSTSHFTIAYRYATKRRVEVLLDDKVAANTRKTLLAHSIETKLEVLRPGKARLSTIAEVPVSFEWKANPEGNTVVLTLRNYNAPGPLTYRYRPSQLTNELLEELTKLMLRRDNRFKELSGEQVDDTERDQLRRALRKQQRKRDAELGGPLTKLGWLIGEGARKLTGKD